MAKKLNNEELEEVKRLLLNRETPQAIADRFNIGVSSIYNYRNLFRQQGIQFPSVQGKKPKTITVGEMEISTISLHDFINMVEVEGVEYYQLILKGTRFLIPSSAKKVAIQNGAIIIS